MPDTPPGPPTPDSVPPRRSLEADLHVAREGRGITLAQIQQETRIPADVLQRLEEGKLLGDDSFNPVYLRALLKAYAQAVGLHADEVLAAYDAQQAGRYAGLDAHVPASSPSAPPEAPPTAPEALPPVPEATAPPKGGAPPQQAAPPEAAAPPPKPPAPTPPAPTAAAPAVTALGTREPKKAAPSASAAEAVPKSRVMRAEAARAPRAFDRSWGLLIGGAAALVVVFAGLLWLLFRDRTPEPEPRPQVAQADSAQARPDSAARPDTVLQARPTAPTLQLPIRVTVTAGGNGLQNFRVTEEPAARLGYWIEVGDSQTFESAEAVVLWGENAEGLNDEAQLELQGVRWTPRTGETLRIDAATGQRLLDSLAGASAAPAGQ